MKITKKPAKLPRLFGAAFVTAAIAASAFAGAAFADEGFEADSVANIYDNSYALMKTQFKEKDDAGNEVTKYRFDLIDQNYKVLHTETYTYSYASTEVTDYGITVHDDEGDDPTYKYGLNTYTGKTLLDVKYDEIEYNNDIDNPTVFAVRGEKGKAVIERYARGTSQAIDTLDIAIDDKDATPTTYISDLDKTTVYVGISYYDSKKEENVNLNKIVAYGKDGMKAVEASGSDDSYYNAETVEDGMGNVVFNTVTTSVYKDGESKTTYHVLLPDGTEVTDLVDYRYAGNNADVANGVAADKFLFVKTDTTYSGEDPDKKVTSVKATAKMVDKDGKVITTYPEQSVNADGSFNWGVFGDYVYMTGSYYTPVEGSTEGGYSTTYTTRLSGKLLDTSGSVVKEFANANNIYVSTGAKDKAQYLVVSAYANFDDSVKTDYDSSADKSRYSALYTTYYDKDLNEVPAHRITSQNELPDYYSDEPNQYMLDGTKLYTGGKFAYDQNDNFVQRAGQYITSIYNQMTGGNMRIGSTDAFVGTTDNGKFGIVASDGTELAASEYDKAYAQYNCDLAMVKKDGKWYFVDLSGRARAEMYRLYNPYSGEHFYTAVASERDEVVAAGWNDEGVGWIAPGGSSTAVFRLYNPYAGEHHYTMYASERDTLVELGWTDEGVGWFSDTGDPDNREVLYREYNPYMESCNHNYTTDKEEHAALVEAGWQNEGTAWYGLKTLDKIDDKNAKAASESTQSEASSDLAAAAL